ncbi:MBL fold metallo-hydrolase [Leucobacter chromiireducens]|uniref:MBL fold metallo-hydrolase n=1 Tax=Leucobacter chromiireducens subsp. solipictus TaxID=398235 RepID=A0ABS1SBC6_9MICO|nr:MBL fold metallo-hydrolase [Leucobacter chromiireducens]MBL3677844.1 MBL fold metallo-hydrolase [Leucobacter chromiireducens subsp. solipictus]
MELAPGLHRIGSDIVAAYLIVTPEGITVIDAGLPGHSRDLQRELATLHRPIGDIRAVLLTHGDSDHLGFAERLRRDHGVPTFIHPGDAERARGGPKPKNAAQASRLGALLGFFAYALGKGGLRTAWLRETHPIHDGETLDLPGAPRVITIPGHSPGSVAFHSPLVDAVFVGDGLTTRHVLTGHAGPQPAPFTDDPAEALRSLERLAATQARWVLPGHGAPWNTGVAQALAEVARYATADAATPAARE